MHVVNRNFSVSFNKITQKVHFTVCAVNGLDYVKNNESKCMRLESPTGKKNQRKMSIYEGHLLFKHHYNMSESVLQYNEYLKHISLEECPFPKLTGEKESFQ